MFVWITELLTSLVDKIIILTYIYVICRKRLAEVSGESLVFKVQYVVTSILCVG